MEVTDKMVEEAYRKLLPVTVEVFGPEYLRHVIKHALTAAIAVAYKDDTPSHKTFIALNERVAKLEQEVHGNDQRSSIRDKLETHQINLEYLELKIDTHIHHNVDNGHTGTAIYPVGSVTDEVREGIESFVDSLPAAIEVTDEDVHTIAPIAARASQSVAPFPYPYAATRAALQAFADRINEKNHA